MPLYEYKCSECGDVFEVMQRFSDAPLTTHDKCGGSLERLLSPPAFQFKGSGWYITDYARASSTKSEKKAESRDGGEKKGDKPAESAKPESK